MRRSLRRGWLPIVGACSLVLGCQQSRPERYPPDPLLLSKRPVESRSEVGPARAVARHEPQAPECLIAALPARRGDESAEGAEQRSGAEIPASLREDRDER
jgi:hypothetical protein